MDWINLAPDRNRRQVFGERDNELACFINCGTIFFLLSQQLSVFQEAPSCTEIIAVNVKQLETCIYVPFHKNSKSLDFWGNFILVNPFIVDYSVEIPTRCSFVIEFIISKFLKGSTCFEHHTTHHQEL